VLGSHSVQDAHEHPWLEEGFVAGRDLAAFRIRGDSMEGGKRPIFDGDLVIVDLRRQRSRQHPGGRTPQDNGFVCKQLKIDKFGVNLVTLNADYTNGTPPYISESQIAEMVGRVVETRRSEAKS
jgi:SOS-response transcriptional repressor LexA